MSTDATPLRARTEDPAHPLHVEFPGDEQLEQDAEWCRVTVDGRTRDIRFHDYHEIYRIPGLYEHLFYDRLRCVSPETVCGLLGEELDAADVDPGELSVLDLGAGNGMVAEEFAAMGAGSIVGVDLLPEARDAAERDRPGVYADYLAVDLTELTEEHRSRLRAHRFNCLVTVAALGFGDIPTLAFTEAFNLVADGGWIALNIKENFLEDDDETGFNRLIGRLLETGVVEQRAEKLYRHRLSTNGDPLDYVAIAGVKRRNVPLEAIAS